MTQQAGSLLGRAIEFRTSKEVEASRPDLDLQCAITLENFAGIVGRCTFQESDRVLCQLEFMGSICRQEHGNGWVAKRKDGPEGYIGKDCANRHFHMDENFARETSRVRRGLRTDALAARLKALLADAVLRERLHTCGVRRTDLQRDIRDIRELLPEKVRTRLREMERTRNFNIEVQFHRVDENDKGDLIQKWEPFVIGKIDGVDGIDASRLHGIAERLTVSRKALAEAIPAPDQRESSLREWVDALEDVERCERDLVEIANSLSAFTQSENMKLLCWTVRPDLEQLSMVRLVLERRAGRRVTETEARETRKRWRQDISNLDGG